MCMWHACDVLLFFVTCMCEYEEWLSDVGIILLSYFPSTSCPLLFHLPPHSLHPSQECWGRHYTDEWLLSAREAHQGQLGHQEREVSDSGGDCQPEQSTQFHHLHRKPLPHSVRSVCGCGCHFVGAVYRVSVWSRDVLGCGCAKWFFV